MGGKELANWRQNQMKLNSAFKTKKEKENDFKQNENKRTFIKENSPQLSSIDETKSSKNTVCLNHSEVVKKMFI